MEGRRYPADNHELSVMVVKATQNLEVVDAHRVAAASWITQLLDAVSALAQPAQANDERLRVEGHDGIAPRRDSGPVDASTKEL